jgi:hypothetical protein
VFLVSFPIGGIVSLAVHDINNIWGWSSLLFPFVAWVLGTITLSVAAALAIGSLIYERRGSHAITALIISILGALPLVIVAIGQAIQHLGAS